MPDKVEKLFRAKGSVSVPLHVALGSAGHRPCSFHTPEHRTKAYVSSVKLEVFNLCLREDEGGAEPRSNVEIELRKSAFLAT